MRYLNRPAALRTHANACSPSPSRITGPCHAVYPPPRPVQLFPVQVWIEGRQCRVGGSASELQNRPAFSITPTRPAAASRCPTFVFTASPASVAHDPPVAPGHTPRPMPGLQSDLLAMFPFRGTRRHPRRPHPRASANAARSAFCCEVPFGTVRPDCAIVVDCCSATTPTMRLPCACASSSRITTNTAAPSPRPYPSANRKTSCFDHRAPARASATAAQTIPHSTRPVRRPRSPNRIVPIASVRSRDAALPTKPTCRIDGHRRSVYSQMVSKPPSRE